MLQSGMEIHLTDMSADRQHKLLQWRAGPVDLMVLDMLESLKT